MLLEGESSNYADVILGPVPRICNLSIDLDVISSSGQVRG